MLTLNDGRAELWQWDTGRTLAVDADCSQVHFSNKVFGRSIDVDVVDGSAIIPDILLQTDKDLNVWAFVGTAENGYTKISKTFTVNRRNKPADYVFTPTDQTTLDDILDRIEDLEKRPSGGNGGITKEVDPTVPDWAKQPQKPTYTATDVGSIPVPKTATVGQTIVVKAVDGAGKPTEWEAADMPSGGGSSLPATGVEDAGKILKVLETGVPGWMKDNGHWETVVNTIWDKNKYITVVGYDAETHIFTANAGELDWATVGERVPFGVMQVVDAICKSNELPFKNFRELSESGSGGFSGMFEKLSDTQFAFTDADHNALPVTNESTMNIQKFHFEHTEPFSFLNLHTKKIRYTMTNHIVSAAYGYATPELPKDIDGKYETVQKTAYSYAFVHKGFLYFCGNVKSGKFVGESVANELVPGVNSYLDYANSYRSYIGTDTIQYLETLLFRNDWNKFAVPRNGSILIVERWVE